MSFNHRVEQLSVQGFITLYELDARTLGGDIYRFHGHKDGAITFLGQTYKPIAIEADGLEMRGDGKASTPTLTIHNDINGVPQALRLLCLRFNDFAGAKLKVIHTLAEYLNSTDEQNYRIQHWFVEQKNLKTTIQQCLSYQTPWTLRGEKSQCAKSPVTAIGQSVGVIGALNVAIKPANALQLMASQRIIQSLTAVGGDCLTVR